jgi:glycosyltransferase involved in cell wall biosynthesis
MSFEWGKVSFSLSGNLGTSEAGFSRNERPKEGAAFVASNPNAVQELSSVPPLTDRSPLVTAVIATYNRANLVSRAIRSILDQTYKNVEIIVVDDGSTDDTQRVLRQFVDQVRVIHQENAGPSAARNRGIAAAKGEIVAFLDSDDLWLPKKIERQVSALQRAGASVACCVCNAELQFSDSSRVTSFQRACIRPNVEEGLWLNAAEVLTDRFLLFNQVAAVRLSALKHVSGFNEKLRFLEDYDLALRLSLDGPFAFIQEPLAIWHQGSEGSLSGEANQQAVNLRELEVRIREDILGRLEEGGGHQLLREQMRGALKNARRRLQITRLRQRQSSGPEIAGYLLDRIQHYYDAAKRRSPWFIEMKTATLPTTLIDFLKGSA